MKPIVTVCLLFLCSAFLHAQPLFKIGTGCGKAGDTVSVDITVDNFTKLQSTQYSIIYDSLTMLFIEAVDFNTKYEAFIGSHIGSPVIKKGHITVAWNDPAGGNVTFPNGTKLFSIKFKLGNRSCDSTTLDIVSRSPATIEILNESGDDIGLNKSLGKVKVSGPGCPCGTGGSGPDPVIVTASQESGPQNAQQCSKVRVRNFANVESFQLNMTWNSAVAVYTSIANINTTLPAFTSGAFNSTNNSVRVSWNSTSGLVNLPNDAVLFEVCANAVGAPGTSTDIQFVNTPIPIEFTTTGGVDLPHSTTNGKYSITSGGGGTGLKLYGEDLTVSKDQTFLMKVFVDGFDSLQAFQFGMDWDPTVLIDATINRSLIPGLNAGSYNFPTANTLKVVWTDPQGNCTTHPNGTAIFEMQFKAIKAPETTFVKFVSFLNTSPTFEIAFTNCDGIDLQTTTQNARIIVKMDTIVQDPMVMVDSITQPKCSADCTGRIFVTTTKGKGPFTYRWLSNNVPRSTMEDPIGLCAGDYTLQLTDNGQVPPKTFTFTNIAKITEPAKIDIASANIVHVTVANDGSITPANPTGGTAPYTYRWNPGGQVTKNINGLSPGMYTLTVSDINSCTATFVYTVNAPSGSPNIDSCRVAITSTIKCPGECTGQVTALAFGGTPPYKYKWTGPFVPVDTQLVNTLSNLCASNTGYRIVVVDSKGKTCSTTVTNIAVREPLRITPITPIDSSKCADIGQSNGFHALKFSGGTRQSGKFKSTLWRNSSGAVIRDSIPLFGVPAGTYTLTIVDFNDCDTTYVATIDQCPSTGTGISVVVNKSTTPGGTNIACNGICTGRISLATSGGSGQFRYKWSHSNTLATAVADSLCAGNYSVTVTDIGNNKDTVINNISITQPSRINVNVRRISCATSETNSDASYEAVVTGGTSPIKSIIWCSGESTAIATSLQGGNCLLEVTDNNNCTEVTNVIVCIDDPTNENCYDAIHAISPNGDNLNDVFIINCATSGLSNELFVFSRWGELVYEKKNYENDWTGTDIDGEELTEGTYMWVFNATDNFGAKTITRGTVTIVR